MNHFTPFLFSLVCLGLSISLQAQPSHSSPSTMERYTDATTVEQTLLAYLQAGDAEGVGQTCQPTFI